jgi:hypothetical protein
MTTLPTMVRLDPVDELRNAERIASSSLMPRPEGYRSTARAVCEAS